METEPRPSTPAERDSSAHGDASDVVDGPIGDAHLVVYGRAGLAWREKRRLEARGRAHFELGSRERDPAVVREHVLV